jgi:multidrug efflux pump
MRRTLGTAVFSGMLGVTLFGTCLTLVIDYAMEWFVGWRAKETPVEPPPPAAKLSTAIRPAPGTH